MEKYSSFQQEAKHLKKTEKVTETSAQTEVLPTTGDKGSHAGLLGLGMLLTLFGLSGKHKGKENN